MDQRTVSELASLLCEALVGKSVRKNVMTPKRALVKTNFPLHYVWRSAALSLIGYRGTVCR